MCATVSSFQSGTYVAVARNSLSSKAVDTSVTTTADATSVSPTTTSSGTKATSVAKPTTTGASSDAESLMGSVAGSVWSVLLSLFIF